MRFNSFTFFIHLLTSNCRLPAVAIYFHSYCSKPRLWWFWYCVSFAVALPCAWLHARLAVRYVANGPNEFVEVEWAPQIGYPQRWSHQQREIVKLFPDTKTIFHKCLNYFLQIYTFLLRDRCLNKVAWTCVLSYLDRVCHWPPA